MSTLTPEQVRHIAKLARLQLSDAEVEKFSRELTAILGYVEMLGEVDTEAVEPTAQVTGLSNVLREDEVQESEALPEELLACSPLPIIGNQVEAFSAHGK